MSIKVMSRVWDKSPEKENRLLLMLALADNANDGGWSYPSQASLALKCRVGRRAIQVMLDRLESEQEIIIYNRTSEKSDEQHFSNVYHMPKYADDPDSPAPQELRGYMKIRITSIKSPMGGVANQRSLPVANPDSLG